MYAVGSINLKTLGRLKRSDFLRDFELNALGAALAVQAALPALKKSGDASVVLFSSIAASQGFSMHASIGMAKAAVSGLTLSLAAELAPAIRVNAIAPGEVETAILSPGTDKIVEKLPMQRLGQPKEVADVIWFLCSDQSSYISGAEIEVNGAQHV